VIVILHYSSMERTVWFSVNYKRKTEGPQPSLCVKICRSLIFVIAPVFFVRSFLSREVETWRRRACLALSATDKYCVSVLHIYIHTINQEACGKEIKVCTVLCYQWRNYIFNFVTGLGTFCSFLRHSFTWYF
jgi:hypothetical protein